MRLNCNRQMRCIPVCRVLLLQVFKGLKFKRYLFFPASFLYYVTLRCGVVDDVFRLLPPIGVFKLPIVHICSWSRNSGQFPEYILWCAGYGMNIWVYVESCRTSWFLLLLFFSV